MKQDERKLINIKVHKYSGSSILASCDTDLIGKVLNDGEKKMKVSPIFYGYEAVMDEIFIDLIGTTDCINLLGKHVVNIGIKIGLIREADIVYIECIPHAQIYYLTR